MEVKTTKITTTCDICKTPLDTELLSIIIYYPVYFAGKTRIFCVCRGCYEEIDSKNYEEIVQFVEEAQEMKK